MKQNIQYLGMAALVLMGAILSGCEKAETAQPESDIVICTTTVRLDTDGAKALTEHGEKTFAEGEMIAVIYKNESSETIKAVSSPLPSGSYGNTATFSVPLVNPAPDGAVRIIYPASMAAETVGTTTDVDADATINYAALDTQDGTLATLSSTLDLAVYDGTLEGTALPTDPALKNKLAICKYTLKNSDGSSEITSAITGMTVSDGTHTYNITPSSLTTIYVAIRPVASANISYIATAGIDSYEKSVTGKTYAAGGLYPLGLLMTKGAPVGAIKGKFSVGIGSKVYFSKGNLQYTGTWQFAEHQYDRIGNSQADNNRDLFGWGTKNNPNNTNKIDSNYSSWNEWGNNVITNGGNTANLWRTLSRDEWSYLFENRTDASAKYGVANVNGVHGIIILPDDYSGPAINSSHNSWSNNSIIATNWTTYEAAGAVFLPASGQRYGTDIDHFNNAGYYWSSTDVSSNLAFYLCFDNYGTNIPYGEDSRFIGCSVRLVRDAAD